MYLKKSPKKNGRLYLSIVRGYRDEKKIPRTVTVQKIGYLDDMQKIFDDPIAHFDKVAKDMNMQELQENTEYIIKADKNKELKENTTNLMNYGYIIILKIYYELGIDRFLINRQRKAKMEYNTSTMLKMLVVSRILTPCSKKKAFEKMNRYFDFESESLFEIEDVYRSLSHYKKLAEDMQVLIHKRITKNYERNMELIYYDVTNYYFEIDMEYGLKKKGFGKDGKKTPIVQMGLAMDGDGLPISYKVFPGNESEKLHLRPMVLDLFDRYNPGKIIAVADSAQNTGNNIYYLNEGKQKYVFSQSIRGGSEEFKNYVVCKSGYEWYGEEYKRKSRVIRREIQVDFIVNGKTVKRTKTVDQRQIVFYSKKYAIRSKMKREAALMKAQNIINNPAAYTKATSYGALKYIKNIEFDKDGEIKETKNILCFDAEVITEEEKYDGYYCIVTNVFDDGKDKGKFGDEKIIDIYRGLWRIEDSFKVTKSDIKTRPFHLSRDDHIEGHFLTCYISLVILRLIQKAIKDSTGNSYSPSELIETMNNISCVNETENLFLFLHRSKITEDMEKAFGINLRMERLTRAEIKKNIGEVKQNRLDSRCQ